MQTQTGDFHAGITIGEKAYIFAGALLAAVLLWVALDLLQVMPDLGSRETITLRVPSLIASLSTFALLFFVGHSTVSRRRNDRAASSIHDLMRVMADGFIVIDQRGLIEEVNETVESVFGYSRRELVGKNVSLLMPETQATEHDRYIAHYLETGESKILRVGPREVKGRTKDGGAVDLELAVSELHLGGRRVFAGCLRDISRRKNLQRQQQMLVQMVQGTTWPVAALEGDSPGQLIHLYCNQAYADLFASQVEEIIATKLPDFADSKRRHRLVDDAIQKRFYKCIRTHQMFDEIAEFRMDGIETQYHRMQFLPTVRADSGPMRWLLVLTDVSQMVERDRALERAQAVAHMGTWDADTVKSRVTWSSEMFRIFGVDQSTFVPTVPSILEMTHLDDRAALSEWLESELKPEYRSEFNHRIVRPNGDIRVLKIEAKAACDDVGHVVRRFGTARDITEENRQIEALRLRNDAIEVSNSAIIIEQFDQSSNAWLISSVNRAFESTTGYSRHEAIGLSAMELLNLETLNHDGFPEIGGRLSAAKLINKEFRLRRRDDMPIDVDFSLSLVPGPGGEASYRVMVFHDITERKRLDQQNARAEKMRALGILTSSVAHDFNNFLAVISANVEILLNRGLTSDQRELAERALRGCDRAAELTNSLLAFSRRQSLAPQVVDLACVVMEVRDFLGTILPATITVKLNFTMSAAMALVDLEELESCLMNLAINSRDAMPGGGTLTFEIAEEDVTPPADGIATEELGSRHVRISVADTGHGMSEDVRLRASEPFFTTKPVGKGTGLGLSAAYGFAQRCGGALLIHSEENVGTRISLYLPLISDEDRRGFDTE